MEISKLSLDRNGRTSKVLQFWETLLKSYQMSNVEIHILTSFLFVCFKFDTCIAFSLTAMNGCSNGRTDTCSPVTFFRVQKDSFQLHYTLYPKGVSLWYFQLLQLVSLHCISKIIIMIFEKYLTSIPGYTWFFLC